MEERIHELTQALAGLKKEAQALLAGLQADQALLEQLTTCLRRHGRVE
jgi:ABC-type sulfate transport system substrate-binding protein